MQGKLLSMSFRASSVGAVLALPFSNLAPMNSQCLMIVAFAKYFVSKSAGLSSPFTFLNPSLSDSRASCSHSACV